MKSQPSRLSGGNSREQLTQTSDAITMEYNMVSDLREESGLVQSVVYKRLYSRAQDAEHANSTAIATVDHNTQPYLNPFANLTSNSGLTYQEISPPATYQSKNEAVLNHSYSDLNANQTINASATYQENPDTAGTKIAYPDTKPYSNDTNPNLESIRAQVDSAHDDREEIK
jgi:hypothetical protein